MLFVCFHDFHDVDVVIFSEVLIWIFVQSLAGVQHLFEIWLFDRFLLQRCCVFANQAAHLDVDIGGRGCNNLNTFAEIGILFGL